MVPTRSAVVMTMWELPENTCTSGSHMIPERSAAVMSFKRVSYQAPHNANGFAVVIVIVKVVGPIHV